MQRFQQTAIKLLTVGMVMLGSLQAPVQAKKNTPAPAQPTATRSAPIDRISFSFLGGVNVLSPYLGLQLSYRLPVLEDRLQLVAQYDYFNSGWAPTENPQIFLLGARYDFYRQPEGQVRAYSQLLAGAIGFGPTANRASAIGPAVELALGAEAHLTGPIWGFAQIGAFFPLLLRSEIGLRLAF